jgi:putative ABC transport system permease protein
MLQDLRFALRTLRRSPGASLAMILSLSLVLGANGAIFSAVQAVMLRPPPFADPDQLVVIYQAEPARGLARGLVSYPELRDWQDLGRSFEAVAGVSPRKFNLPLADAIEPVQGEVVSPGYFALLGVHPLHGRLFASEGDPEGTVCLLGHGLWQRRFGTDPGTVGKQVRLGSLSATVIGILPESFGGLHGDSEVWVPLTARSLLLRGDLLSSRGSQWLTVVGRLRGGTTRSRAEAEVSSLMRRLDEAHGGRPGERRAALVPIRDEVFRPEVRRSVAVLMAAVVLVLLTACANLTTLLLARANARRREIAVRLALGASRRRLIGQFFTESLLMTFLGGVAGLVVASWGIEVLSAFRPPSLQRVELALDPAVLSFTLGLSLVTGILLGLLPAVQSSRPDLNRALKA